MTESATVPAFDPNGLAHAVDENLYDLFRAMAQGLSGGELDEGEALSRHHSFPTNPMFKGVWRCQLMPDRVVYGATQRLQTTEGSCDTRCSRCRRRLVQSRGIFARGVLQLTVKRPSTIITNRRRTCMAQSHG